MHHCIYQTREPIMSEEEISTLKLEAGAAMASGTTSNFTYTQRHNLGEVHTAELPRAKAWLTRRLADTLFPMLADRYGLGASSLRVFDSLIIRYDAAAHAVRQPMHRDGALLSVNIALSAGGTAAGDARLAEYTGGGTYFEGLDVALANPKGHALVHPSGIRHGGYRILSGVRWVLVLFVLAAPVVQAPRRVTALAWDAQSMGEFRVASAFFRGGLTLAAETRAENHEIHAGLGAALAAQGEPVRARQSYLAATHAYPLSPKAHLALGKLLLTAGRPRAALRRFEAALAREEDPSDDDAWEARFHAGLCGTRLATAHGATPAVVAGRLLPRTAQRLREALQERPGHVECASALHEAETLQSASYQG